MCSAIFVSFRTCRLHRVIIIIIWVDGRHYLHHELHPHSHTALLFNPKSDIQESVFEVILFCFGEAHTEALWCDQKPTRKLRFFCFSLSRKKNISFRRHRHHDSSVVQTSSKIFLSVISVFTCHDFLYRSNRIGRVFFFSGDLKRNLFVLTDQILDYQGSHVFFFWGNFEENYFIFRKFCVEWGIPAKI